MKLKPRVRSTSKRKPKEVVPESLGPNNTSLIKDRARRADVYHEYKRTKKIIKDSQRKKRADEKEKLGDHAPPKNVPHTLETLRTPDATMVLEKDEEVLKDEQEDEFRKFFQGQQEPKVLITSVNNPKPRTKLFIDELLAVWSTYSEYYPRKNYSLKKITEYAIRRKYTDLIVINEAQEKPFLLILSHLPKGPTATFRISSFKAASEIPEVGVRSAHAPELNLKNFNTRLGRRIGRMLQATFRFTPNFKGRAVVTIHNQRDFMFFRMHRYIFDSLSKVRIQELGPRFTLRLKTLQHGLFDTKFGEFEWAFHKREMGGRDRRMFNM